MSNKAWLIGIISLVTAVSAHSQSNLFDRTEFSGFGRLIGGYLETDQAVFNGYDDSISFDQESLVGLQADIALTDSLSFTTQLLAHSAENRKSGIEWMYLSYDVTSQLQFRFGKQRTPFYNYSDVLDVGFAYPWITPPTGVYNRYVLSNYEGINGQYTTAFGDTIISLEGYWGSDEYDITTAGERFSLNINDLKGLVVKFQSENLSGRVSANSGEVKIPFPRLEQFVQILQAAGFDNAANSLNLDDTARIYHAGFKYEELDWFVEFEYSATRSGISTIPTTDAYALTGAYTWYPYTLFATVSVFDTEYQQPENDVPVGVSPELDALSLGLDEFLAGFPIDNNQQLTIGLRYDMSANIALKGAVTLIDGEQGRLSSFDFISEEAFDRQTVLYQFAVEWVF